MNDIASSGHLVYFVFSLRVIDSSIVMDLSHKPQHFVVGDVSLAGSPTWQISNTNFENRIYEKSQPAFSSSHYCCCCYADHSSIIIRSQSVCKCCRFFLHVFCFYVIYPSWLDPHKCKNTSSSFIPKRLPLFAVVDLSFIKCSSVVQRKDYLYSQMKVCYLQEELIVK